MSNKYNYEIKDGFFNLTNTEKNTTLALCNFTAKIVKETRYINADGDAEIFYHLQGKTQEGEVLNQIKLSAENYEKGKWFRIQWGAKAELYDIDGQANATKHLLRAISRESRPIPSETVYTQTGLVVDPSGQPMFLFGNGAVTAQGIVSTTYGDLPQGLSFFRLPDNIGDKDKTNGAITGVFDLLKCSENNPTIGSVLCLAAFRATISMWLPIEQFIFLIGPKGAFERGIAEIIQSFFGAPHEQTPLISWDLPPTVLESYVQSATNAVLVVDDFVYPTASNRRHEFAVKVDKFLLALAKGLPTARMPSLKNSARLNCLVISSGVFAPREIAESLHEHGIYVPFKADDINGQDLTKLHSLAKDSTFVRANVAFIQYLLADFQKNSTLALKWFEQSKEAQKRKFQLNERAASNIAGLVVGWVFFSKFAKSREVISEAEYENYLEFVKKQLRNLMSQQQEICSSNPGQLFINGLSLALKDGKAHLIDSQTGEQPDKTLSSKVGWKGDAPNGLWIGWLDAKTNEVIICGDLDIVQLINLLPVHDRALFSKGVKKFWKDLKGNRILNCQESDRNSTRQVLPHAKSNKNYHINMVIIHAPSKSSKPSAKPEKPKLSTKGMAIQEVL